MKKWRALFRCSLILIFCNLAYSQSNASLDSKVIEVEWEPVPDAVGYEVQLTPTSKGKTYLFRSSTTTLNERLPYGRYWLRIRSKSKDGTLSAWSERAELDVVSKVLRLIDPQNKSEHVAKGNEKQSIEFKWSPVEKAKRYTLKVWTDVAKDKPYIFTTTSTNKRLKLVPGRAYNWQVTFESADGVDYYQEPETFSFIINGTRLLAPSDLDIQKLTWKPCPGAQFYQGKLFYRHLDEETWTLNQEARLDAASWPMEKLKPGFYKLELVALAPRRMNSEVTAKEFLIKPTAEELNVALSALSTEIKK